MQSGRLSAGGRGAGQWHTRSSRRGLQHTSALRGAESGTAAPGPWDPELDRVHSSHYCSTSDQDGNTQRELQRWQAYTAYLAELQAPAGSVPLLRCTTLVAQALRHPARQHSWVEAAMDRLARKVARQLPAAPAPRYPLKVLRTLLDVLYNQQGFRGQLPAMVPSDESSLIDQVLTHRGGTRLTLSLLVMEVARRLDLSLKPVQLPGCLLLALDLEGVEVLVDAFRGELLVPAEVADRVEGATGKPWRPQPGFIQQAGRVEPRRFLWLWLDELKQSYLDSHQMSQALCVVRLMRATLADQAGDLRDEGICLYALTRFAEAASALAAYLKVTPLAPDALLVWQLLEGCPSLQQQRHQVVQAAEEEDEQEQRVSTTEDDINSQDAEEGR
ncbi:Transglutaminase-like superfamily-domain-containing protein [Haematococcus lacustris]